jgi:hypothetical protein
LDTGGVKEFIFVYEKKFSLGIHETPNQPWTGDPIYLDVFSSDPLHSFSNADLRLSIEGTAAT